EKFIALFWARRDPTPQTARNEFREEFENRVRAADTSFKARSQRGALTERGRALILYGAPKRIEHSSGQSGSAAGAAIDPNSPQNVENSEMYIWTYEDDQARKYFNQPRVQIRFSDRLGNADFRAERAGVDLSAAQQRAITASLAQPDLKEVPTITAAAPQQPAPVAAVPAAPPAAPAVQTELTTEALKNAVAEFKKSGKTASPIYVTTGEYVTAEGVTYAPVSVYLPKAAPGANATFFGIVEDASGKSVIAFEEPAKPHESRGDYFVDRSLTLAGGKYRGYFGIADGDKISIVAGDLDVTGALDKDATATSQMILANNVYVLEAAQAATDPYAFGGMKVVPKGDHVFKTSDDLWYFIELRNPGVADAGTASDATVQLAPGPKLQVKLDVEGTLADGKKSKMAAPPMEVAGVPIKGVPNHYAVGNSIPLATFKPGDYTITAKLIDTVKKTSYTFKDTFKVVQ
ncbi:MAG TPA: GWxTD domain-containing protein, partial [Thermoanaerobaculia bacterium]|nr:GWxTD domain-containing protein [Thermoanaerobaculia bacterium]